MSQYIVESVYNLTWLLAMSIVYSVATRNLAQESRPRQVIVGLMVGVIAMGVMAYPMEEVPGFSLDTRSIVFALSGMFFGLLPTLAAVTVAIVSRLLIGGLGFSAGILVIVLSAGIGILWHSYFYERLLEWRGLKAATNLIALGLAVHAAVWISAWIFGQGAVFLVGRPGSVTLILFPISTALIGQMLRVQIIWHQQEDQIAHNEAKYRRLVTEMGQGLALHEMIYDENGKAIDYLFLDVNSSYSEMTGMEYDRIIGRTVREVLPAVESYWIEKFDEVVQEQTSIKYENYSRELGKYFEVTAYPVEGKQFAVIIYDTTDRFHREKEIEYLSFHDQLTGLYNRRFFEEELSRLDVKRNYPISLIMADVNDLKLVNDAFGHDIGDELLQAVSEHFRSAVRQDDIISRIGGDEFVFILPRSGEEDAQALIQRINSGIDTLVIHDIQVSVSMGSATKESEEVDIWSVYNIAEDNMYRNKMFEVSKRKDNIIDTIINTLYHKNERAQKHSERVSALCVEMGKALGYNTSQINELRTVGLLHDIGKIALDDSLLSKTDQLSLTEWKLMKSHSEIGFRILSSVNNLAGVSRYVLAHHEHWDGSGYPEGLKGEDIPVFARIIALAEAYDAMTCDKPYQPLMDHAQAVAELRRCAGTQFDPELTEIFVERAIPNYKEDCQN